MGGGDGQKKVSKDPANQDVLSLELTSEFKQIPMNAVNFKCSLLANVTACAQNNEDKRAPVTICAAIDRSASMKEHLPLLKETIEFMITQLRSEDKLCLVTFDHEVKVDLPVTNMDVDGKRLAERAVKSIKERGHTNLSGGLLGALQALHGIPADQATLVESVVLFSDGKANFGITNAEALSKATRSLLDQIGRQGCVFTIGYGTEHDPDMLHGIANAGGGLFYYIENKDNIPDSFCDCLGGLLSVAAQNVKVTFTSPDINVRLSAPMTAYPSKCIGGNSFEVNIPDVYHDEEKSVPVEVLLSSTHGKENGICVLNCTLEYFDVMQCKSIKDECSLTVEVSSEPAAKPVESPFGNNIRVHILRCQVIKSLVKATELADNGQITEARDLLNTCKHMINANPTQNQFIQYLLDTIEESLSGLSDTVVYKRHGKPTMMHYLHSHGQQRSSTNPSKHGFDSEHGATAMPFTSPVMLADNDDVPVRLNPYMNDRKRAMKVKFAKSRK